MILVDVNVPLDAVNSESTRHAACHAWWERTIDGGKTIGLSVRSTFVRLLLAFRPAAFSRRPPAIAGKPALKLPFLSLADRIIYTVRPAKIPILYQDRQNLPKLPT